jgi:hypothetical protein
MPLVLLSEALLVIPSSWQMMCIGSPVHTLLLGDHTFPAHADPYGKRRAGAGCSYDGR